MDSDAIDNILSIMTPEEVGDAIRFVDAWQRYGTFSATEAEEWRKRIVAKQALLETRGHEQSG